MNRGHEANQASESVVRDDRVEERPETVAPAETRSARARRYAHRTWLYFWAALSIVVFVLIVILIAQNTRSVRVGWVFGHSRVSIVILVVFSVVLGWILGIATGAIFRQRTRRAN